MTSKRRYNPSLVSRLPPPDLPPPEYFSAFLYSYEKPLTNAEIAVNPCVSSKKISGGDPPPPSAPGGRTYRIRNHHQNQLETKGPPPSPRLERPSASLSQGIFGLPAVQPFISQFLPHPDTDNEESLADQTPPKPRMKTTLPSWKPSASRPESSDMEGILQIRPASRSRTRPYQNSTTGQRRRVQSVSCIKPSSAETLPPDPADIENVVAKLRATDFEWEEISDSFLRIVQLSSDYPAAIKPFLKKIIWAGIPHLSSARSKLSRAACQCFKDLYQTQRRAMEGEGDKVFHRLLDLCGGPSNKFIQEESKAALLSAVQYTDPLKSTNLLELHGCRHKNPNVREFAAVLLHKILEQVALDKIMDKDFAPKVLPMIVGFLKEGQLNTR